MIARNEMQYVVLLSACQSGPACQSGRWHKTMKMAVVYGQMLSVTVTMTLPYHQVENLAYV